MRPLYMVNPSSLIAGSYLEKGKKKKKIFLPDPLDGFGLGLG
jgi:hypothetical protein